MEGGGKQRIYGLKCTQVTEGSVKDCHLGDLVFHNQCSGMKSSGVTNL